MLRGLVVLLCTALAAWLWPAARPGPAAAGHVHPLPFFYDLYTFRGPANSTEVVAAFAVPAGRLEREPRGDHVRYRFDVTLVLADTALRTVFRTDDSVFVSMPRALSGDHLLFTHIEVQAPPSRSTMQRVIMSDATTPGIGQLYTSAFPIPDYRGDHLMLSDLALGQLAANSGWRRGEIALALLPTSQFPESAFDIFYEIYNLQAGHRYSTDVAVEPVGSRGEPVRVRYSGEAAADERGTVRELRRVDASVGRGTHRLTVTITDHETGQRASRSREFHVRGWGPGATLVTALPRRDRGSQRLPGSR